MLNVVLLVLTVLLIAVSSAKTSNLLIEFTLEPLNIGKLLLIDSLGMTSSFFSLNKNPSIVDNLGLTKKSLLWILYNNSLKVRKKNNATGRCYQGLFLSVLPKTQFRKNAEIQFESPKTQCGNSKTENKIAI